MKKTFIYLFILLCFACRNKQEYTLCGTLYMDSNTVVDMLGIQMEDTLLYVKVDSAGYFSTTIPFREVVFCNLFGVAVTGEERWQFVTPVALQAMPPETLISILPAARRPSVLQIRTTGHCRPSGNGRSTKAEPFGAIRLPERNSLPASPGFHAKSNVLPNGSGSIQRLPVTFPPGQTSNV